MNKTELLDQQIKLTELQEIQYKHDVEMKDGVVYSFYYAVFKETVWKLSLNFASYNPDYGTKKDFTIVKTVSSLDDISQCVESFEQFIKSLK